MSFSLNEVNQWLLHYKYFALFPLAVLEGPIVTVIAGFLTSLGVFNLIIVYLVIVAGDLAGDVIHYYAGRWGGIRFIERWGKYIGIGKDRVLSLQEQFARRGDKLLFIGKMSHGIGGAFLIAAGLIKMPLDKFLMSNFLATLIKSLLLLMLGYYFGWAIAAINVYFQKIAVASIAIAVFLFLIYFFYFRKKTNDAS